MAADIIIVVVYLAAVTLSGLICSGKAQSVREFSVAGGGCSTFVLLATLASSYIGGGFSTGNAANTAQFGIGNMAALCGFSLSMVLVGLFVVPRMGRFSGAMSAGDIMRMAYGRPAQVLTGLTGMLVCCGILGAQISAIGYVFNVFLGLPTRTGILIGCALVLLYSTFGGMGAVVAADVVQFVVLGACMPLLLWLSLKAAGGIEGVISATPPQNFDVLNGRTLPGFVSLFLTFAMGEALSPPLVQRLLMGRKTSSTRRAVILAGLFSVPFFIITGLVGMAGAVYFSGVAVDINSIMQLMIKAAAPVGLRGLMIAGMLAIVTSSADSFLNSAAVGLVADVIMPLKSMPLPQKKALTAVRLANLGIGAGAVLVAIAIPGVLEALTFSYSFWSPVALVPLAAALLGIPARPKAVWAGAAAGIVAVLVFKLCPPVWGRDIDPAVAGCAANLMFFILFKGRAGRLRLPTHSLK